MDFSGLGRTETNFDFLFSPPNLVPHVAHSNMKDLEWERNRVNGVTYLSEVVLNVTELMKNDFCKWGGEADDYRLYKVLKRKYLFYIADKRTSFRAYID